MKPSKFEVVECRKTTIKRVLLSSCLGIAVSVPFMPSVYADTRPVLEEVIVTAQKREERLQDVPVSVATISGSTLESFGISAWDDVRMPGLNISQGPNADLLSIRGVGSALNLGAELSSPIYIDGAYFGRGRAQRIGFLDIERIEILKGPQPTFFGKNAIAGAYGIITRKPTDEFEAGFDAGYEFEADEFEAFGFVSGPVNDKFKLRVAAKYRDMKGYIDNVATGQTDGGGDDKMARISALIEPADTVAINLQLEYANIIENGGNNQLIKCVPGGRYDPAIEDCKFDTKRAVSFNINDFLTGSDQILLLGNGENKDNRVRYQDYDQIGGRASIDWDINGYSLSALTSYYEYTNFFFVKADHSTRPLLAAGPGDGDSEDFSQFSQELRVTSAQENRLGWMAGAYFDTNDYKTQGNGVILPGILGVVRGTKVNEDSDSWAVFAEASYDIAEEWKIKVGGRYEEVKKSGDLTATTRLGAPRPTFQVAAFNLDVDRKDTKFTPAVTLEWRPIEKQMYYVSYKEGFKAGGFDHAVTVNNIEGVQFDPEQVDAYEIGAKIDFLDGAARFNVAAFRMDYENLQQLQYDSSISAFVTDNAADAVAQGIELDVSWAATEYLVLSAAGVFLDNEFKSWPGAQCFQTPPQTVAQGCVGGVQDLAGTPLTYAPDFSANFSADFSRPLNAQLFGSSLELVSRFDVFYSDDYQTNTTGDPNTFQSSYTTLDFRLGLMADNGAWEVAFVGRNLTDEIIAYFIGDQPGGGGNSAKFAMTGQGRQLGIQTRFRF